MDKSAASGFTLTEGALAKLPGGSDNAKHYEEDDVSVTSAVSDASTVGESTEVKVPHKTSAGAGVGAGAAARRASRTSMSAKPVQQLSPHERRLSILKEKELAKEDDVNQA